MPDVFISYARSTAAGAARVEEALRASGYTVWRNDALPYDLRAECERVQDVPVERFAGPLEESDRGSPDAVA